MNGYVLFVGGAVLLTGIAVAIVFAANITVSGVIAAGIFFAWSGLLLMLDKHPEFQSWDRYERRVYGLAFLVLGVLWSVLSFSPLANYIEPPLLCTVPPLVIALVGKKTYVKRMRRKAGLPEGKK